MELIIAVIWDKDVYHIFICDNGKLTVEELTQRQYNVNFKSMLKQLVDNANVNQKVELYIKEIGDNSIISVSPEEIILFAHA